jgi:hypothetical protein
MIPPVCQSKIKSTKNQTEKKEQRFSLQSTLASKSLDIRFSVKFSAPVLWRIADIKALN